jgi:PIN domain nuclease of toxin-antitoxin system
MKFLFDTHAWIWAVLGDRRLGPRAQNTVRAIAAGEKIGLSAISFKEAAWLLAHGRVVIKDPSLTWPDWLRAAAAAPGVEILPLTTDIAIESEQLSNRFPLDPADRLIGATARLHGLTLLTRDKAIRRSREVTTLW